MPGDRNLGIDHAPDRLDALFAAFHLARLGAAFFHEAGSVPNGVAGVNLIRPVRHVGDQQRILHAPVHGLDVVQHLVHRNRERVLVTKHGHSQRVADQDNVDASLVDQARRGIVVGGQAGDGFALKLLFADGSSGDLVAGVAHRGETHNVLQCPSANRADRACTRLLDDAEGIIAAKGALVDSRWSVGQCLKHCVAVLICGYQIAGTVSRSQHSGEKSATPQWVDRNAFALSSLPVSASSASRIQPADLLILDVLSNTFLLTVVLDVIYTPHMVETIDIAAVVKKLSAEFDALIDERQEVRTKSEKLKARADEIDRKLSGIQKTLQGLTLYTTAQEVPTELMKKTTMSMAEAMKKMKNVFDVDIQIAGPDVRKTLSECCRDILRQKQDWMSPVEVREALLAAGFDFSSYTSNPLSSIHTTLKRMVPEELLTETRADGQVYRWKLIEVEIEN